MTHVGDRPRREMKIDMPLFGGEYSMGTAPYDVAEGLQGMAQTAYDFKTMPAYFFPPTAPFALGADVLESRIKDDPLGLALNLALTPQGFSAAKSAVNLARRNPKTTAAAVGTGAYLSPDEAEAGPERWFSKAMEVARAIPMEKMTGQQALAMLRKGVSPEELRWTGADAFLPQQKQITKQDLVDYLAKNRVQTQDVVFGGTKPSRRDNVVPSETAAAPYKDRWDELVAQKRDQEIRYAAAIDAGDRDKADAINAAAITTMAQMDDLHSKMVDATIEEMGGLGRAPKYQSYATPGGEGYRETLVTLPVQDIYTPYVEQLRKDAYQVAYKDALDGGLPEDRAAKMASDMTGKFRPHELARLVNKTKELNEITLKQEAMDKSVYKSPHWDDKNVIGHIRSQMLTANPPGANRPLKLFNVDENQSDLAQSGRKQGFVTPEDRAAYPNMSKQYDAMNAQRRKLETIVRYGDDANGEVQVATNQLAELDRQMTELADKMTAIRSGGVPAAPYVTSTQGWTDFSIKKALDQAIDSEADYFTFTPGEVHAERYNLARDLSKIEYEPNDDGTYLVSAIGKDGRKVYENEMLPEDMEQYFGKEVAQKIVEDAGTKIEDRPLRDWRVLSNEQIKTKGDAMVDAYNNIYKRRVEKVVKDATGKKVTWEVLPAETADGIVPRLGFRIDEEVKNARFSDFNKGGRVADHSVNKALELTRDY
jgi:hypothetical protein